MNLQKVYCFLLLILCYSCNALKIYDNLVQCYRSNNTEPLVPNTIQVLIELIRKIENHSANSFDIRTLSVSLIHKLRIDGIQRAAGIRETEYVTPYDATSLMRPKMEILLTLISEVNGMINFDEILTPVELCTLHKLISSSVDSYKRGDEQRTCLNVGEADSLVRKDKVFTSNQTRVNHYVLPHYISKCPTETGIIKAYDYGTLSPGTVIGSIAAGLEPQLVFLQELVRSLPADSFENLETMERRSADSKSRSILQSFDTIDNTYAANLAGDLAEVCVYQAPYERENVTVGSAGYWNDTVYPIARYLTDNHPMHWTMTDAEILGGIDGLHLTTTIRGLVNRFHRIRLSQVLEMYYSPGGIPSFASDSSANSPQNEFLCRDCETYVDSACEREKHLIRIPHDRLKEQTYFAARVLQDYTRSVSVDPALLRKSCNRAVDKFFAYARKLLLQTGGCAHKAKVHQPIDLTVLINGPRNRFENLKLISHLSELVDVSVHGSTLSIVHGSTGEYLVTSEKSIVAAFDSLRSYQDHNYPNKLSLTDSLSSIVQHLNSKVNDKQPIAGNSEVILVVAQQQQITDDDFTNAKRLIETSFQAFPDLHFIFLTDSPQTYRDLIAGVVEGDPGDKERYSIIESSNLDPMGFSTAIHSALRKIPRFLHIPVCRSRSNRQPGDLLEDTNSFEDYVSRDKANFFRINPGEVRQNSNFWIKFRGVDYGAMSVCMSRDSKVYECQSTLTSTHSDVIWFNVTQGCDNYYGGAPDATCLPFMFKVELESSKVKCTENDCRYPDQVRYYIDVGGECDSGSSSLLLFNLYLLFISVIVRFFM